MLQDPPALEPRTKGERTAQRILDVAENLFAQQGYEGTSLRQIAQGAALTEPALYNHFSGKQALYEAVLHRALNPMAEAMAQHIGGAARLRDYTELPAVMTDLLLAHPQMASLFQQAMQGDAHSMGNKLVAEWLAKLFSQGMQSLQQLGATGSAGLEPEHREVLAINLIAMFNLTTGYFLSQRAFATLAEGNLQDPDNIERQKRLLHKVIRAMLIN